MGLDTVELVLGWEDAFGVSIDEASAARMRTTSDAIDHLYSKVKGLAPEDQGYLAVRAFYRLRSAFRIEIPGGVRISPNTRIADIFKGRDRRDRLSAILNRCGFTPLARLPFGLQWVSGTVGNLVVAAVVEDHSKLRLAGHGWSKTQVREVARAVMTAQFGLRQFSDNDRVVKDLGLS